MPVSNLEWQAFYGKVRRKARLDLSQYKPTQLQRRVIGMMESRECRDLRSFWTWLDREPTNLEWFLDRVAINVSELFRNPEKWLELETKVLPLLPQRPLRCWSAGCSYGAEAFTLAMILRRTRPGPHRILGTDIDVAALRQAEQGLFDKNDLRCVPREFVESYLRQAEDRWAVSSELKKMVRFSRSNLLDDEPPGRFDLILCRNVVIYFTDEAKDVLYRKFYEALEPGGILFVGSTERIFQARDIGFDNLVPFFYEKSK